MVNEGTPSYKYIDDKIKLISDKIEIVDTRLDKLIKAHESDFTAQKRAILETQQFLAQLIIRVMHNETITKLTKETLPHEFFAELTAVKIKLSKSTTPLIIANEFVRKREEDLKKLGVEYYQIPS